MKTIQNIVRQRTVVKLKRGTHVYNNCTPICSASKTHFTDFISTRWAMDLLTNLIASVSTQLAVYKVAMAMH